MSFIILSPKAITAFQQSLKSNLESHNFTPAETGRMVEEATNAFRAIAYANPLKPKKLPEGGLDAGEAMRFNSRAVIVQNPALLFEAYQINVPRDEMGKIRVFETPEKKPKSASKLPRSKPVRQAVRNDIPVTEIVAAAREAFSRSGARPNTTMGEISGGMLDGTKWSKIYVMFKQASSPYKKEGLKSLSQLLDLGMVGSNHRPVDLAKARMAFATAFQGAAAYIRGDGETEKLPYVFQMLEESLTAVMAKTGVIIDKDIVINEGPLRGMEIRGEMLESLFSEAVKKDAAFPYQNLFAFINKRKILQSTAQIMSRNAEARSLEI